MLEQWNTGYQDDLRRFPWLLWTLAQERGEGPLRRMLRCPCDVEVMVAQEAFR